MKIKTIKMNYTKKQIKQYLQNPNECPKCKGQDIVIDGFDEESMSRCVECDNCGEQFHEVYQLVTIEKREK